MKLIFSKTREKKSHLAEDIRAYDGSIVDVPPKRGMQLLENYPRNFKNVIEPLTFQPVYPPSFIRKEKKPGELRFTYFSNSNANSSFSIVANNHVNQLRNLGYEVEEKPLDFLKKPFAGFNNHFAVVHLLSYIFRQKRFEPNSILESLAKHFRYLVGFDVADTNHINQNYVRWFNNPRINAIMLPTQFCYNTFRQSGVLNRLYIVPHGISEKFQCGENSHRSLRVLTVFTSDPVRKGLDILRKIAGKFASLQFTVKGNPPRDFEPMPNMEIIRQRLSEEELVKLYQSSDVYLHPYRGGGFELCPLEALACGLPVVSTGWGCILDYCNIHNSYLANVVGEFRLFSKNHLQNGSIAEPDEKHLRELLSFTIKNLKNCKEKALKTSKVIRRKYSWENSAKLFIDACKEIIEED